MVNTRAVDAEPGASARSVKLEELYVLHAPGALRLAYFLTGDRELAEDLVQEAFVRIAGRFAHLRVPYAFDAYLRRTVVNLFTSQVRRRRLERREAERERAAVRPHEDRHPVDHDDMWRAVLALPERQRAAIVLRFYEDLSEQETADVLRCSRGAAKQLVVRAMETLRGRLGDDER
jgi:RNA polymerase sigma-70 factor (sigma-E family)